MSGFDEVEGLPLRTAEAADALAGLEAPARAAARSIEDAFAQAGETLARSLARAAADGQLSLAELARAVLGAVSGGRGSGLGEALSAAVSGVFSGARAEGGPVTGGGAYLVGERGPEVFRPAGAGTMEPVGGSGAGGAISVTVQVASGEAAALARSDAQLAQALARAVSLGARRL